MFVLDNFWNFWIHFSEVLQNFTRNAYGYEFPFAMRSLEIILDNFFDLLIHFFLIFHWRYHKTFLWRFLLKILLFWRKKRDFLHNFENMRHFASTLQKSQISSRYSIQGWWLFWNKTYPWVHRQMMQTHYAIYKWIFGIICYFNRYFRINLEVVFRILWSIIANSPRIWFKMPQDCEYFDGRKYEKKLLHSSDLDRNNTQVLE